MRPAYGPKKPPFLCLFCRVNVSRTLPVFLLVELLELLGLRLELSKLPLFVFTDRSDECEGGR